MSDPPPPPPPPVPPPIEEWVLADPPPARLPVVPAEEVELLISEDADPPLVPVVKPRPRPAVEELPEARPVDRPPFAERVAVPTVLATAPGPRPVPTPPDLPEPERPQARVILALAVLLMITLAMVAAVTVLGYTLWAGFQKARPAAGAAVNQPQEPPAKQRRNR